MKPDLQRLPQPWMTEGPAAAVMRALTAEGDQARFVGGCVRDALVGRNIRDIDIATPLSPQRVTELLHKAGIKAVPTGIDHGTITAVADKTGVEVTTLRLDVETDGRRAKVAFTDNWQADAATGALDESAVSAAKELAPNLKSLSGERLRQETLRLLTARRGPEVWGEMLSLGIVQHYLPWATSLDRLRWVAELEQRHGLAPDPIRRLAALTMTGCGREVAETLKLSRA